MKTIKIKGYKVALTIREGSNYNHFVSIFAPGDKTPLCGTSRKNEADCIEWAKIKIDQDLNTTTNVEDTFEATQD